jgi:hypothetical protein
LSDCGHGLLDASWLIADWSVRRRECAVIHRILQNSAFTPEQIKLMSTAYEAALAQLKLRDRNDPLTLVIAKAVIDVAQTGERDPMSICTLALQRMEGTAGESAASASMHP